MLSQPNINLSCVFARTEHIIILSFKQTESDKINTGSFIYSMKGKGTKLGTLQALTVFILCTNYPSNPTMPTQLLFV